MLQKCTCAFPFEGNGNKNKVFIPSFSPFLCTCAFPFEGNGNACYHPQFLWWCSRAHVLSRLKGMETDDRPTITVIMITRAHVLSRLKGMETLRTRQGPVACVCWCTCAFPFEGNGNFFRRLGLPFSSFACTCAFPFEGNGNIFHLLQTGSTFFGVHMCFPV